MLHRSRDLCLIPLLCAGQVVAQSTTWYAHLPMVQQQGLHAVVLDAHLLGASRADLGDIRLLDSAGIEVPYVLREVMLPAGPERFVPFALLRHQVLKHSTELEIECPEGEPMDELHIRTRPLEARKKVRITGSDDRVDWYMVKDEQLAMSGARGDPPHQVLSVTIPRTDYRYLRLALNDSLTPPMKVLGVGRFMAEQGAGAVFGAAVDLPFQRSDSARWTHLRMALPGPVLVERLTIGVEDTVPYQRRMDLVVPRTAMVKERRRSRVEHWEEQLGTFVIRSGNGPSFPVPAVDLDTFELRIANGDDRPLRIGHVRAQCRQRVVLARLEPGMRYRLVTGDERRRPPDYDLAHFADELPIPLDTLAHHALEAMPPPAEARPPIDPGRWWIWAAILVLMAMMGWMASRMLRRS